MKKDLLIFGDSYGEEELVAYPQGHPLYSEVMKLKSFHEIIRESREFNSVTSYAKGGADLWSQYEIFLQKYTGKETVVWFVTQSRRLTVDNVSAPNLSSAEFLLWTYESGNMPYDAKTVSLIKSVIDFFTYLQNDKQEIFLHKKILEDIKLRVPNITFVNGFATDELPYNEENALCKVFHNENRLFLNTKDYTKYQDFIKKYYDLRRNHMTEENHMILAEQLLNTILLGLEFDYSRFKIQDLSDFSKYFKLRN